MSKQTVGPLTRTFSCADKPPLDSVEWESRSVEIADDSGKVIFKEDGVEVPKAWSHMATKVVVSKYFYGVLGTPERERSIRNLLTRVCRTIADWAALDNYYDKPDASVLEDDLTALCLQQAVAFNSPVWFNAGLYQQNGVRRKGTRSNWHWESDMGRAVLSADQYEYPQSSACFIQRIDDNMESIMQVATNEAMLFKFGSGTGSDLSNLRSSREMLSGGGKPSGPLSFLRIYDQVANVVKSGGKTRRAAKMNILKDRHPDIEEFIDAKPNEEKKAWALIAAGYDGSFGGTAYDSVMFQNENLSVRISDEFMHKAIGAQIDTWFTKSVTTGANVEEKSAVKLLKKIAEGAWLCGDPGVQFDDTINAWHTCPASGRINATNPCSEYIFLDNSACNLASLNLMKFLKEDGDFDTAKFTLAVRLVITAQEILVDRSSYPTKEIAENSHKFRPLGLGYANLGALLMFWGIPYDSYDARSVAAAITAIMTGAAYAQSATIAGALGPFSGFKDNRQSTLKVLGMHRDAALKLIGGFSYLRAVACDVWAEACALAEVHGVRNAQVTVLAPTGTIGFMMDCDTTGIEPDIALVKYKNLSGGGNLKIVNQTVPAALKRLGYSDADADAIVRYVEKHDTIEGESGLKAEHLPVFDCALRPKNGVRSIQHMGHIRMMAAVQPFLSGGISKTVNMPNNATVEDVRETYIEAWRLGLKCVAIYRDGSKKAQPLNVKKDDTKKIVSILPVRRHLPATRTATTHKFQVAGHEGYLTVGYFEDGKIGELFIAMAKEGSTIGGLMDCIGTLTSIALQYGVPLDTLVSKFEHQRFEPSGYTANPEIKTAASIIDYVFRWMNLLACQRHSIVPALPAVLPEPALAEKNSDFPTCPKCGHLAVRSGACWKCMNCGESLGCS